MLQSGGLYEKVLARLAEGSELPEMVPPRASAAVVLWRRAAGGTLEVFWLKRSERLAFMGGFYAFPGGGLSRRDASILVRGSPAGVEAACPGAGLPAAVTDGIAGLGPILAPGLVACALRELYEETGVLLAPQRDQRAAEEATAVRLARARRRLLAEEQDLAALLTAEGLTLDAASLVYAGRWLTPPLGPLRFDNRFFLLRWPQERALQPEVLPAEAERGEWVRPAEAVERWRRGELMTAPPILHILEVLAQEGPEKGLERLRNPVEANLGPFRRVEFRPGVLLFPLRTPTLPPASYTNAYVLGTREAVLIDPGSPHEREIAWLREALETVRERLGRRITAIWLTHHHPDHVGGVAALRSALEVPVLAHPAATELLSQRGIPVDGELADGQRFELAGDPPFPVRVIHTPGHARGHLCFLEETFGSLVSGDLVAGFGTIVIDPPEGNMSDYLDSLARLRKIGPQALFPAHGPTIGAADAKLEAYIRHREWREERILTAWRSGLREPAEMLETVYDDVPRLAHPLAERQIVAHLERLEAMGRLNSS